MNFTHDSGSKKARSLDHRSNISLDNNLIVYLFYLNCRIASTPWQLQNPEGKIDWV